MAVGIVMDPDNFGVPMGFPNHEGFQLSTVRIDHFQQYIVACLGVEFLCEVEVLPYPLRAKIVWTTSRGDS